jgi:hypothetical protein
MRILMNLEIVLAVVAFSMIATSWAAAQRDGGLAAGTVAGTPDAASIAAGNAAAPAAGSARRVGGDLTATVKKVGDRYRCLDRCSVEAPLPEGYPAPTPPGAIEIKHYPVVRRAEVSGDSDPDRGRWTGFWPLFSHIKSRKIAMTAPVEVDYEGLQGESETSEWTMAFLYRHRSQGETGRSGRVNVLDAPARVVLSIGVRGPYGTERMREPLVALEQWLARNPGWVQAGTPRALYYNSPMKPSADKWCEVQIPIEPAERVKPAPKRVRLKDSL